MSSNNTCDIDEDCPGTFICYPITEYRQSSFCGCQAFYGWVATSADSSKCEVSISSIILISILAVPLPLLFVVIGMLLKIVVKHFKEYGLREKKNFAATSALLLIGMISTFGVGICIILEFDMVNSHTTFNSYLAPGKLSDILPYTRAFYVVSLLSTFLSEFSLAFTLYDVASKSFKVSNQEKHSQAFRVLIVTEFLFVIGMIGLTINGNFAVLSFVTVPFVIALCIGYLIGGCKLSDMLINPQVSHANVEAVKMTGLRMKRSIKFKIIIYVSSVLLMIPILILNLDYKAYGVTASVFIVVYYLHVIALQLTSARFLREIKTSKKIQTSTTSDLPNSTTRNNAIIPADTNAEIILSQPN